MVTSSKTVLQCHTWVTNTDAARHRPFLPPRRSLVGSFCRRSDSPPLPHPSPPLPLPLPHRHPSPGPWPLAMTNLFSISMILSFGVCYINRILQYVIFGGWLFPLSIISWRFIQTVLCIECVLFIAEILPVCKCFAVSSTITVPKRTCL